MQESTFIEQVEILNHIQHGIVVIDGDGGILYCNSASEKIFGYKLKEIAGKSLRMLHDDDDYVMFEQLLDKCKSEKNFKGRWRAKCKNASRVWLDVRSSTIYNKDNERLYCVLSLNNIETLETVKKHLKKVTLLEKTILEKSADAIITADEEGNLLGFNRAAVEMFGYEKKEIIGKNIQVIIPSFHPKKLDVFIKRYNWQMGANSKGKDIDMQGMRKDGSLFFINMSVSEVPWNENRMVLGIIRDLTKKRELEKQMVQIANEERRRIGRELHDGLGQMLTGIRMVTESLARKLKANEIPGAGEVEEISEMLKEADEHTRALSRGLVEVHLVEKGLTNALENLKERIPKIFGVNCTFTDEGEVDVDNHTMALHIYRIVQEAVTNAVRHSDAENIHIHLLKNNHTTVTIEDDGTGFNPNEVSDNGSGIQIMKYRADLLGGTLDIYRTEDDMTCVRCIIPNNIEYSDDMAE